MASPIAASAAATVRMNRANTWPVRSLKEARKGDQVDVHGQQNKFYRHQDDDDVLAIEDDPGHADGEQDRCNDQIVGQADYHLILLKRQFATELF